MKKFFILFVFKAFICRECIVAIEIGVSDLVDDVLANDIDRSCDLIFDEVKVAVYCFLKKSAFWLYATIHSVLFYQCDYLFFS